jgi:hypothetical protein
MSAVGDQTAQMGTRELERWLRDIGDECRLYFRDRIRLWRKIAAEVDQIQGLPAAAPGDSKPEMAPVWNGEGA